MKTSALLLALALAGVVAATGAAVAAPPKPTTVVEALASSGIRVDYVHGATAFRRMQSVERWARRATALVVIAVVLYDTWSFTVRGGSSL